MNHEENLSSRMAFLAARQRAKEENRVIDTAGAMADTAHETAANAVQEAEKPSALIVYIDSEKGDDKNDGTKEHPLKSIFEYQRRAAAGSYCGRKPGISIAGKISIGKFEIPPNRKQKRAEEKMKSRGLDQKKQKPQQKPRPTR